jgi:hypothetical protein
MRDISVQLQPGAHEYTEMNGNLSIWSAQQTELYIAIAGLECNTTIREPLGKYTTSTAIQGLEFGSALKSLNVRAPLLFFQGAGHHIP